MLDRFFHNAAFFTLVNRLERYHDPAARVGELGPASSEIIRFRSNPSLAFAGTDVACVERLGKIDDGLPRYAITVNFFGLVGAVSPLPTFYSEEVLQNDSADEAQRKFLDFFHHRLLSLAYKAGLKYRFLLGFQPDCSDAISHRLLATAGFASAGAIEAAGLHPKVLLRYAGLLYHRPRSASVLQTVLTDFLGHISVAVRQFTLRWVELSLAHRTRVGRANATLGQGAIMGARVKSCSSSFRLILGPMTYDDFIRFLPCSREFSELARIVRLFVTDPLDFDIEVRVLRACIPAMTAAGEPPPRMASRLGWTSWLQASSPPRNPNYADWRSVVFQGTRGRKAG